MSFLEEENNRLVKGRSGRKTRMKNNLVDLLTVGGVCWHGRDVVEDDFHNRVGEIW
jgi:hypothetical protein